MKFLYLLILFLVLGFYSASAQADETLKHYTGTQQVYFQNPNGYCYPMCGVFDPWGKKSIYNNRTLYVTKPEIAPNPAKDFVDVYTTLSEKGLVTLNVYDQLGNLLIKDVKYSDQEFKFTINTSNLVNGTYFISLLLNGKILSTGDQFIINR